MKRNLFLNITLIFILAGNIHAQYASTPMEDYSAEEPHSVLPADGIISYLPDDSTYFNTGINTSSGRVRFQPLAYFFFRPETTSNYKEAGLPEDKGHLNFYLRGDFGGKLSLPKNIDLVANLHSYGLYTRSLGPLDPNLSLYEAYVDMKKLDRAGKMSVRFGRMCLGKYGTEILVGDDDFGRGRSFESLRYRYHTDRWTSDVMWVQLYQEAPDSADFDWNHPIFLANFNTFKISNGLNVDANLVYIIDQYNSGYRTSVLMPNVRVFGHAGHIRYSAEAIYQTGIARGVIEDDKLGNVNAYAAEVSAGYFSDGEKVSFDVAYYRGSGDNDLTDTDLKSYNVLWQNEHRRFGYIDAFKGSNAQAVTFQFNWRAGRLVDTGIHGVFAQVLESKDRSPGIATVNLNTINTDNKTIGYGGDWYLNYYFNHYLNMQLSVSVFKPGEYFTAANGIDKTMMRMYLMLVAKI